ncbi:MAG: hypothetical protein V3T23_12055 [Nitrososphaerales archaeon]
MIGPENPWLIVGPILVATILVGVHKVKKFLKYWNGMIKKRREEIEKGENRVKHL